MLGPADIEDMMLEFAAAEAAVVERDPPEGQRWPPTSWSWGVGPAWGERQTCLDHTPRFTGLLAGSCPIIKHRYGKI